MHQRPFDRRITPGAQKATDLPADMVVVYVKPQFLGWLAADCTAAALSLQHRPILLNRDPVARFDVVDEVALWAIIGALASAFTLFALSDLPTIPASAPVVGNHRGDRKLSPTGAALHFGHPKIDCRTLSTATAPCWMAIRTIIVSSYLLASCSLSTLAHHLMMRPMLLPRWPSQALS